MSESAWSNEAWVTTTVEVPPSGDEWAGLVPNKFARTTNELYALMDSVVAGDTVGIYPGVYVGTNPAPDLDPSKSEIEELRLRPAWAPAASGTQANPITFVAQHPASAHSSSSLYTDLRSGSDGNNWVTGQPWYNPIQGRYSTLGWPAFGGGYYSGGGYTKWVGIYSNESDDNNKIYEDCGVATLRGHNGMSVTQSRLIGDLNRIYIGNNYSAVRLEDTRDAEIGDNYITDFYGPINTPGICVYESADYQLQNNDISNCGDGVHLKGGGRSNNLYGTMSYNHIHACDMAFRFHGPALGPNAERTLIKQNLIEDCELLFQQASAGGEDVMTGVDFLNNTAVGVTSSNPGNIDWTALYVTTKDNTFINNIHHLCSGYFLGAWGATAAKLSGHMAHSYNCITNSYMNAPESHTLASWRSQTGQETGSITSDPLFVGSGDYRLQAGSPCRTAGVSGGVQGCYITGNETIGVR